MPWEWCVVSMVMWHNILPTLFTRIISVLQASNLRHEYYTLQNEHEIMWTALCDIKRMSTEDNIKDHVEKIQELINNKHMGKRKIYRMEG
jgi:hypothetical protein